MWSQNVSQQAHGANSNYRAHELCSTLTDRSSASLFPSSNLIVTLPSAFVWGFGSSLRISLL